VEISSFLPTSNNDETQINSFYIHLLKTEVSNY
jgi:hypothetical protein